MTNTVLQRLVDERDQINRDIDHVNEASADEERDPSEPERSLLSGTGPGSRSSSR